MLMNKRFNLTIENFLLLHCWNNDIFK